jgi:hypothetical protein
VPSIASDGTTSVIAYYSDDDIFAKTFSTAGVLGSAFTVVNAANEQSAVNLTYGSGNFYGVWSDKRSGTWAAYGSRMSTSAVVAPEKAISAGGFTCTPATLTPTPASPQNAGASIALTATSTCTAGATAEYEWWVVKPGTGYQLLRTYGTDPNISWSTSGLGTGTYTLELWTRAVGNTSQLDGKLQSSYAINGGDICASSSFTMTPSGSAAAGTTVSIAESATCTGGTPEYRIWTRTPGGAWSIIADYPAPVPYSWNTTGLSGGTWTIEVDARRAGSGATRDSYSTQSFTISGGSATCTAAAISLSPSGSVASGTTVQVTETASCSGGSPQYKVWAYTPGGIWEVLADYSAAVPFSWNTSGRGAGTYNLQLFVRAAGSTATYQARSSLAPITLTGGPQYCPTLTASASPASPQNVGAAVTLNATATCTSGQAEYWFQVLRPDGAYQTLQNYGNAPYVWNTGSFAPGTYTVYVKARAKNSTAGLDTYRTFSYTLL